MQGFCWSLLGQGDIALRLDRAAEARALYDEAIGRMDEGAMLSETVWAYGGSALASWHLGDHARARDSAARVLPHITGRTPVAFWTQVGTAATAEALLSLVEQTAPDDPARTALLELAARACTGTRRYARRFPLGRSHASL
jgi:hypothetical protein